MLPHFYEHIFFNDNLNIGVLSYVITCSSVADTCTSLCNIALSYSMMYRKCVWGSLIFCKGVFFIIYLFTYCFLQNVELNNVCLRAEGSHKPNWIPARHISHTSKGASVQVGKKYVALCISSSISLCTGNIVCVSVAFLFFLFYSDRFLAFGLCQCGGVNQANIISSYPGRSAVNTSSSNACPAQENHTAGMSELQTEKYSLFR